ncbi:hypothetical protein [Actinokineospora inagensis]|uniref:hypothetical protein n=1 Tax=Actinokineospora inagensis TaxID=103730 RepID=UPI0004064D24|nr:hypothetical protein [Actinokineospora inagensis]
MRKPTGVAQGATAAAAIAFVTACSLPWMANTPALPLLGHAFTMRIWFLFEPPGPGPGLEMATLGLLTLTAITAAYYHAHRTAAATAAVAIAPGISLIFRDHPGLSSGYGATIATTAVTTIAIAQTAAAFHLTQGPPTAGAATAVILAVAAGFAGAAHASARDIDATTSAPGGPVTISTHDNILVGITATDSVTGTERWHYWSRDSTWPHLGLSPDGNTAYLFVNRVTERDVLTFDAHTGKLLERRFLAHTSWGDQSPGPAAPLDNE